MPIAKSKLTTARALALRFEQQPGSTTRYVIFWCPETPGFGCRVTVGDARSWITEQRVGGRSVRRTLGPVHGSGARGGIEADTARKKAKIVTGELATGVDSAANDRKKAKTEKVERRTFGDALRDYVRTKRRAKDGKPLKARTVSDYLAMVDAPTETRSGGALHPIAGRSLARLTATDLRDLHRSLLRRAEQRAKKYDIDADVHLIGRQAGYAMQVVRSVLRYEGITMPDDPFALSTPGAKRISIAPSRGNPKTIPRASLGDWWLATLQDESRAADVLRLALLTGMRSGEVATIKVQSYDAKHRTLTLGDPKNRKRHVIYLSTEADRIVSAAARSKKPGALLFGKIDARKAMARVNKAAGITTHLTPNRMRHSFTTLADSLAVPRSVRNKLVNQHAEGVGDEHYVEVTTERMTEAWALVSNAVHDAAEAACRRRGLDPVVTLYSRDLGHLA